MATQPIDKQRTASNLRQVLSVAISAAYTGMIAAGDGGQLPTAVKAIIVAFGPVVVIVEHYLSDPSTGTPTPPSTPLP
jgi:hypothetical protein